tara:strand:- start:1252 stop:2559 length:1308 start_codon:yes stop_codon:yes gene_type:complete
MKKKLLICIQNSYVLNQYEDDFRELSNKFDITLIISNYLVVRDQKEKLKKFANNVSIDNFFIIPFYSDGLNRGIFDIIKTHLFLKNLKKKINFDDFSSCISDSKFFLWHRIILETFLNKSCIQIGIAHSITTMPVDKFEDLINGKDIYTLVKSMHKLREVIKKEKKTKSFLTRLNNFKKRFLDIIVDRQILSYFFHKRNFNYKHLDFNLVSETEKFDFRITFFYSAFYFWNKWYNNGKVYICSKTTKCVCKEKDKNKMLFVSSGKIFVKPFNTSDNTHQKMYDMLNNIISFVKKIKNENPSVNVLDIKHHPRSLDENKNFFKIKLKEKIGDKFTLNYLENTVNITKIACNYKFAFGPVTASFQFLENCKNIKLYCLKSLNKDKHGDKYFLKLINEKIIFFDDEKKIEDENLKKYQNLIEKKDKIDFCTLISRLSK